MWLPGVPAIARLFSRAYLICPTYRSILTPAAPTDNVSNSFSPRPRRSAIFLVTRNPPRIPLSARRDSMVLGRRLSFRRRTAANARPA
jgi:hypothetical protein